MALVQSLKNQPILVEKIVTVAATSGTTVGVTVPADSIVLAAGFENLTAVPNVTAYTLDVTDGTTVFANDLDFDAAPAGTTKAGVTPGFVSANDTIDVVTSITGAATVVTGRVFALISSVEGTPAAAEVDRDQLA